MTRHAHKWGPNTGAPRGQVAKACTRCHVEMRVKEGTVGTCQYRMDEMDVWAGPIPCGVDACCGGNDETPPWHTQDCGIRVKRAEAQAKVTP